VKILARHSLRTAARRQDREGVPREKGMFDYLRSLVGKNAGGGLPYFVHFGKIDKLGLNPQQSYASTPMGIYFYPVTAKMIDTIQSRGLYRMDTNMHVFVVRARNPKKVAVIKKSTAEKQKAYEDIKKSFWGRVTEMATKMSALGWEGVYDTGFGVIHDNEPAQAVFFSAAAVEVVNKFSGWESDLKSDAYSKVRENLRKTLGSDVKSLKDLYEKVVVAGEDSPLRRSVDFLQDTAHELMKFNWNESVRQAEQAVGGDVGSFGALVETLSEMLAPHVTKINTLTSTKDYKQYMVEISGKFSRVITETSKNPHNAGVAYAMMWLLAPPEHLDNTPLTRTRPAVAKEAAAAMASKAAQIKLNLQRVYEFMGPSMTPELAAELKSYGHAIQFLSDGAKFFKQQPQAVR
jgi:hypothetical protein